MRLFRSLQHRGLGQAWLLLGITAFQSTSETREPMIRLLSITASVLHHFVEVFSHTASA